MKKKTSSHPSISPEVDKRRMRSLAMTNLLNRLEDGTATSQMISLAMSISSEKEEMELEKLKNENALLVAKREALESQKASEQAFNEALEAFKRYSGNGSSKYDKELQWIIWTSYIQRTLQIFAS